MNNNKIRKLKDKFISSREGQYKEVPIALQSNNNQKVSKKPTTKLLDFQKDINKN